MTINYIAQSWPIQDTSAVCLSQSKGTGGGNLILNGTYYVDPIPTISFFDRGFVRNVSLTSANDLSGAVFTVSGVQNSTVVNAVLNGPNNNTVYTTECFDIISSVSVNSPVSDVSVGTGLNGYFPLISLVDLSNENFSVTTVSTASAFSFITQSSNGCTYSLYESLSDLTNNGQTYASMITNSFLIPTSGSPYTNLTQTLQFTDVCTNIVVKVISSINNSTLYMQFLQPNA
jgi:hypothetical protein